MLYAMMVLTVITGGIVRVPPASIVAMEEGVCPVSYSPFKTVDCTKLLLLGGHEVSVTQSAAEISHKADDVEYQVSLVNKAKKGKR